MPGFDHDRQEFGEGVIAPDKHHLRARNHDVAHLQVADLQHALEHTQRVRLDQPALPRFAQYRQQLVAILRLANKSLRDFLQPPSRRVEVFRHHTLR